MQTVTDFNTDLITFLNASPTPFHAVDEIVRRLNNDGFECLNEDEDWQLKKGGRYYVTRNNSSIVAFIQGKEDIEKDGFRLTGAHTDSPCLKVKPQPELHQKGYFQLGVEVYGGALLNPWFDRDLSLAGRVTYRDKSGSIRSTLIDFERPVAIIPSLAIHLDREANTNKSVNPQKDIPPLVMLSDDKQDLRELLLSQLHYEDENISIEKVLDYDLSFYDTQSASMVGLNNDFIASARLDNLLSCYVGLQSLLQDSDHNRVLVCNDHEEVGSTSAIGAQGPMLRSILRRLVASDESLTKALQKSLMISADNAHGIHPNYIDKHDSNHGPLLNAGPVIKTNANQRYATDGETSALFRHLAEKASEAVQSFVVRSDMGCGSTIGPIAAAELGVKTLDVGVPTFGMHSIREVAGSHDAYALYRILCIFNNEEKVVV